MITLLKTRFLKDDGSPFAGFIVKVTKDNNSPVRLYTRAGSLIDSQGYSATDSSGLLQVYVGEPGVYLATVVNEAGNYEYARKFLSTSESSNDNPQPRLLAQSAVPIILPSSGSSNATGRITHTTALPYQPSGVVWIRLPAGVVTAGSAGTGAGLYPVIYSSTTVCQIQGTGIVTANGAYTQTTATDIVLATVVIPGGAMGANGALRVNATYGIPSNANTKTAKIQLNAIDILGGALTATANPAIVAGALVRNRGVQNAQVSGPYGMSVATAYTGRFVVDTSINQNLTLIAQIAVAADYNILEGYGVELLPMA